jgi:hypothetical protein
LDALILVIVVVLVAVVVAAMVATPIIMSRMTTRAAAEAAARARETELALQEMARGQAPRAAAPRSPGAGARQSALQGRGLVLESTSATTGVTRNGRRFDRRIMTLEVEVAGMAPYIVQGSFLVPRGQVEVIPGASLELSVDGRSASDVTVLGPGGFTGPWLNAGPPRAY